MRVKTTAVAVLVVGVAVAFGGLWLVVSLRSSMLDQVRASAQMRAQNIAQSMEAGDHSQDLTASNGNEMSVQVVDSDGQVVASSGNLKGLPPLAQLKPGESSEVRHPEVDPDGTWLVVAEGTSGPNGHLTVLVARDSDVVTGSTASLTRLLAFGLPFLLVLVAAITWWIVGRTLAPVDAIRNEADAISVTELFRRVPDRNTGDEISRLAATVNRMLARLESANIAQQRFISDASHELKSPVASIRQHVEVALAHPEATTVVEVATVVHSENLRVQQLVEDLLYLARRDERSGAEFRREVDLDDLVFEEAARLREPGSAHIDSAEVSTARISGDPIRLHRMLRNLGDNALRHCETTIKLTLNQQGNLAVLTVEDDGDGVPESERIAIFDRFVRLDEARTRDKGGSGLGLAIVADIVQSHGGSVAADQSELGGAKFVVKLPAHDESTIDRREARMLQERFMPAAREIGPRPVQSPHN